MLKENHLEDVEQQNLEILRHSTAHLLAQAVKRLYPRAQLGIGPVIENGFYYDFAVDNSFNDEDLVKIESEMRKIAKEKLTIVRHELTKKEAIKIFTDREESLKLKIIDSLDDDEIISAYEQGEFIDLCRGPHVASTGKLKVFKLLKVAGAYWQGDANQQMLQRIYGTAWLQKVDQKEYLTNLEEAKKRDHRKLGAELDLFHIQEEAPGMVFWHAKGCIIYNTLENYMREIFRNHGYEEVRTPEILSRSLWEKSGHWDKFYNEMYTTKLGEQNYSIKPMNCPCHVQIFNQKLYSYKDLPVRFAEFGSCHRRELSGTLHGLLRVRKFVQDDAHIFCTVDQIMQEAVNFDKLVYKVYEKFGFTDVSLKLSTRPEKRVGSDELWNKAENMLQQLLVDSGKKFTIQPGEGAFYGPKLEYTIRDSIGRNWQLGTLQLDFSTPGRLSANYVDADGKKQTPVMLHRAIFGSFERFIGILIEHYSGKFPYWLAPVQVAILNISEHQENYARKIHETLTQHKIRCILDLRNEKINYKIRNHTLQKVPYMLIIGDKEVENEAVAVRILNGENLGTMSVQQFLLTLSNC